MPIYTPNIPQPGDNPSTSQDQMLQNFETLNNLYGSSGDHYPWTDTSSTEIGKHAKVTLPGLPTANAPGNSLPSPLSGNCSIFSQTVSGQTTPYLSRDGLSPTAPLTNIWPLLPIKAYATWTQTSATAVSLLQSFNVTSVTSASGGGNTVLATITFANQTKGANYGVLVSSNYSSGSDAVNLSWTSPTTTNVIVRFQKPGGDNNYPFNLTAILVEA